MNPYAFWAKLAGIGLAAGVVFAAAKLLERLWAPDADEDGTFEYTATAGEFPDEDDAAEDTAAPPAATAERAAENAAKTPHEAPSASVDAANAAAPLHGGAHAPDTPNENPVDAPPAAAVTDPLQIADPRDFQDWDGLGCQG